MDDTRSIAERLADMLEDPAIGLTTDGSGVGGLLASVFGGDMTAIPGTCAHCQTVTVVASLRAYARGPGVVLRCPACTGVVLRIAEMPTATIVDVSGVSMLRFERARAR